jgi:uncharacterized protein GlcG (DUF336 family)
MNVTLERANGLICSAVSAAQERGVRIAAVVLDTGGNVVAAQRMDDAYLSALSIAERKAFTAVNFRASTTAMRERLSDIQYQIQISCADNRLAFLPGGFPITADDGAIVGAIGVSGGSAAQDVELCEIALGLTAP